MNSRNSLNLQTAFITNFYLDILLNKKNKSRLLAEKFKNEIDKALATSKDLFNKNICDNVGFITISIEKTDMFKLINVSDSVVKLLGLKADSISKNRLDNLFPKKLNFHYIDFINKILDVELKENSYYDFSLNLIDINGYLYTWNTRAMFSVNFVKGFNLLLYFTGLNTAGIRDVKRFIKKYEETKYLGNILNMKHDFYVCFNENHNFEYVDSKFAKLYNLNQSELSTINLHTIIQDIPVDDNFYKFYSTHVTLSMPVEAENSLLNGESNEINFKEDNETNKYKFTIVDVIEPANGKLFFGIISEIKTGGNTMLTRQESSNENIEQPVNNKSAIFQKKEDTNIQKLASHKSKVKLAKLTLVIFLMINIAGAVILLSLTNTKVFNKDISYTNKEINCKNNYTFLFQIHIDYLKTLLSHLNNPDINLNDQITKIKSNINSYEESIFECFNANEFDVNQINNGHLFEELRDHKEIVNMLNDFDFLEPKIDNLNDNFVSMASYMFNNTEIHDFVNKKTIADQNEPALESDDLYVLFAYSYFVLLGIYFIYFIIYVKLYKDMRLIVVQSLSQMDVKKLLSLIPVYKNFISQCLIIESQTSSKLNIQNQVATYQNLRDRTMKSLKNLKDENIDKPNKLATSNKKYFVDKNINNPKRMRVGFNLFKHKSIIFIIIGVSIIFTAYYLALTTAVSYYRRTLLKSNTLNKFIQAQNNNALAVLVLYTYKSSQKISSANFKYLDNALIQNFYDRLLSQEVTTQSLYKTKFENNAYVFDFFQNIMNVNVCEDIEEGSVKYEEMQIYCGFGFNTLFNGHIMKIKEINANNYDLEKEYNLILETMDQSKAMNHVFHVIDNFLSNYFKRNTKRLKTLQIAFTVITVFVVVVFTFIFFIYLSRKITKEAKIDRHLVTTHERYLITKDT